MEASCLSSGSSSANNKKNKAIFYCMSETKKQGRPTRFNTQAVTGIMIVLFVIMTAAALTGGYLLLDLWLTEQLIH